MIDTKIKEIKQALALQTEMLRNGEYPSKESDKIINKAHKNINSLMSNIINMNEHLMKTFINWFTNWQKDKNLDDYSFENIYDEFKKNI